MQVLIGGQNIYFTHSLSDGKKSDMKIIIYLFLISIAVDWIGLKLLFYFLV